MAVFNLQILPEVTSLHFLKSLVGDYEKPTVGVNKGGIWVQLGVSLVGQPVGQSVHQCLRKGQLPLLRGSLSMLATILLVDISF